MRFWILLIVGIAFFSNVIYAFETYRIVIDPGHGGAPQQYTDDHWDESSNQFLGYTNYGSQYKKYHEHRIVLALAKRVKYYLDFTKTRQGWKKFSKILNDFVQPGFITPPIHFQTILTRDTSWEQSSLPKDDIRINDPYRLFDFPNQINKIQAGRFTRINQYQPYLVLSLHMTYGIARKSSIPSMSPVLSPSYDTFQLLREISLGQSKKSLFYNHFWYLHWVSPKKNWTQLSAAIADAWSYFNGWRSNGRQLKPIRYRGFRQNYVTWRYRDPNWVKKAKNDASEYRKDYQRFTPRGRFFLRERSSYEHRRREYGSFGQQGGDNYYAAMELLRYIQFGVRLQSADYLQKKKVLNQIRRPFVSNYGLPIYTNAIVAMLELGFINNSNDLKLLQKETDIVAKSLAVGIYSLFHGLEIKKISMPKKGIPLGKRLPFEVYTNSKDGNYFEIVSKLSKN